MPYRILLNIGIQITGELTQGETTPFAEKVFHFLGSLLSVGYQGIDLAPVAGAEDDPLVYIAGEEMVSSFQLVTGQGKLFPHLYRRCLMICTDNQDYLPLQLSTF
ncbi:hypothetical protein ES703_55094 [subsurface metagenome]